jgi:hypothetical protein
VGRGTSPTSIPASHTLESAESAGQPAETATDGQLLLAAFVPAATGEVEWTMEFEGN